ncbi:hypothetical protein TSUD_299210 [Trifolium subterraneum]|nr:hypothetical protein TSUD_299210 [Trifolium subterraneum]
MKPSPRIPPPLGTSPSARTSAHSMTKRKGDEICSTSEFLPPLHSSEFSRLESPTLDDVWPKNMFINGRYPSLYKNVLTYCKVMLQMPSPKLECERLIAELAERPARDEGKLTEVGVFSFPKPL